VDWTLVFTTIGSAAVTGAVGYLIARKNAEVDLKRLEADNERLRAQHREDHLRNRQATYHTFLVADRELYAEFVAGGMTEEEYNETRKAWEYAAEGVRLFGTEAARDAIDSLEELYEDVFFEAADPEAPDHVARVRAATTQNVLAWKEAHGRLLAAMRADVGPT
jgi:hypothetical protein